MNRAIEDELKELGSRLAGMQRRTPFQLPQPDYLDGLPAALMAVVQLDAVTDPQPGLPKAMAFHVPDGYLETLPDVLLGGAKAAGEASIKTPFEVPSDYFGTLPAALLDAARTSNAPPSRTRTVRFPLLRRSMPWLAAAAILSGVWLGVGRNPGAAGSPELRAESALAKLDGDSIGAYVEQHVDEFDPETLEASLAGTQVTDFKKAVSELPNDEIESYLNDAGSESEAVQDM